MEGGTTVRLTEYCTAAGCAAKLGQADLERVLEGLTARDGLEAGVGSRDDAGWLEFGGGLLLQTVDFFTPIVDDPYRFGQIAAANALSDVYAMGGEPLTALNLVAFPKELELELLGEVLEGGAEKIAEAEAVLLGGHSIRDREPKYGISVTGFVQRERLVQNQGARPGDALVLTKPLGVGILTTAAKRDLIAEAELEEALDAMAHLNRAACEAMQEVGVSAATDVTGYGLLGHLAEMVAPSGLGAVVRRAEVPVWDRAAALAADGCSPGGLESNRTYLGGSVLLEGLSPEDALPLYDPQTSGGLLMAVAPDRAGDLVARLGDRGEAAALIGEVVADAGLRVTR